ncbi:hypothetical protein L493_0435 [Bordetella bronchiseptica 99-R-0433]|nr:hypothetical protein L493_0435 [Bordetella bronchiseptica 99-R-0433]
MTVGPRRRAMKAQRQNQHGRRHTMTTRPRMADMGTERLATLRHIFTSQSRNPCYTQATEHSETTFGDEMALRPTHYCHIERRMRVKVSQAMTYEQNPTLPVSECQIHEVSIGAYCQKLTRVRAQPCNQCWPRSP